MALTTAADAVQVPQGEQIGAILALHSMQKVAQRTYPVAFRNASPLPPDPLIRSQISVCTSPAHTWSQLGPAP